MSESEELARLGELHRSGVLSDEEFVRAKARVLNGQAGDSRKDASGDPLNALRRTRDDRWLGGVCGGIARVTASPSWLWRLLFTILAVCAGTGVLFYILLWIFVPLDLAPDSHSGSAKFAAGDGTR
jgi:phage shock protein PspC (stress-responsive transcriptional regulator)